MLDTKSLRKRSTVRGDVERTSDEQCALQYGEVPVHLNEIFDQIEKYLRLGRDVAQDASRLRNDTMIDFDVGVSLSSPALASGTRTFSSG